MRKIKLILGALVTLFIMSCEGPQGPPGFDGLNGQNGEDAVNILGKVVEIQGTFSAANDFSISYEFPDTVEVFESDLVLVYLLFEQVDDPNGGDPIDVWRLLPQTRILDQGLLQYNFDHTFTDVNIFLESDFDLSTLPAGDTDDQIFRIAVVPAEFGTDNNIDVSNLNAVMGALKVDTDNVETSVLN
ncbi:collagen-like protein [uncultured Croceitalea sp.]|uniref:collagen-like protein n=1 Tax=uncultured Croceitalea sp. TaxID=1798908 RepID=UPI00374ED79C